MILTNTHLIKPPIWDLFQYKSKIPLLLPLPRRNLCCQMGSGCWGNWPKKKTKLTIEGLANGVVAVDASMADEPRVSPPQHLVIMVNGLIGSASDWKFAADQFVKQLPHKVVVHRSECNPAKLTFDGVDLMGERLADEVLTVVRHRPELRKISFVAHSLGGLVARYAIGRLYEPPTKLDVSAILNGNCLEKENFISFAEKPEEDRRGRIAGLEPVNFITVATPHLGSRGHKQLCITLVQKMCCICKSTLMFVLTNCQDVVGWSTSSIRRLDELPKANLLKKHEKYRHIVYTEKQNADEIHHETSLYIENQTVDFEEEMIRGLNQVPWERVDVSFHKSRQRYVAHNTIQVKSYWLNSDGADVIFHMIDNFQL